MGGMSKLWSFFGIYRDNGKENGNYYSGLYREGSMGGCQNDGPFLGTLNITVGAVQ